MNNEGLCSVTSTQRIPPINKKVTRLINEKIRMKISTNHLLLSVLF